MANWWVIFPAGQEQAARVAGREAALRRAIESWRAADEAKTHRRWKAVLHAAKQVHAARLRAYKAQLSAVASEGTDGYAQGRHRQVARLRTELATTTAGGIPGILAEFGVVP